MKMETKKGDEERDDDEREKKKRKEKNSQASPATEANKNAIYPLTALFAPPDDAFEFVDVIAAANNELLSTHARRTLQRKKKKRVHQHPLKTPRPQKKTKKKKTHLVLKVL
jgi:hypothetical protein